MPLTLLSTACCRRLSQFKALFPEMPHIELIKEMSKAWKQLSDAEKGPWLEIERKDQDLLTERLEEWRSLKLVDVDAMPETTEEERKQKADRRKIVAVQTPKEKKAKRAKTLAKQEEKREALKRKLEEVESPAGGETIEAGGGEAAAKKARKNPRPVKNVTNPVSKERGPKGGEAAEAAAVNTYEVEAVVDKKQERSGRKKERVLYLVKWAGFDSSLNTWEPQDNLRDSHAAIEKFEMAQRGEHCSVVADGVVRICTEYSTQDAQAFLALFLPCIAGSRGESGCIQYDLLREEAPCSSGTNHSRGSEPWAQFRLIEAWRDEEGFVAHWAAEHTAGLEKGILEMGEGVVSASRPARYVCVV